MGQSAHDEDAFTLIEMIGVLAVIAILAVIIVPNLLHQLDIAASQQEVNAMQTLGNALQSSVTRNFYIPGSNDWVSNIAVEAGLGSNQVATNSRGLARVFLIDPTLQVGTNAIGSLPYSQTINGAGSQPTSPRLMILSTIGKPLPAIASSDFSNIWNTADGTLPTAGSFSTWTANDAYDLKVQRIGLSPLFVPLVLNNVNSTNNGFYSINPSATITNTNSVTTNGVTAYYIQNSVLRLINNAPLNNIVSDQILVQGSSYVYYQGAWGNSLGTPTANGSGVASVGSDFSTIVANFLTAPINPQAQGGATPAVITQDMINFLNAYDAWASSSTFPAANAQYNNALSLQGTLTTDLNHLANGL